MNSTSNRSNTLEMPKGLGDLCIAGLGDLCIALTNPPWELLLSQDRGKFHHRWQKIQKRKKNEHDPAWQQLCEEMKHSILKRLARAQSAPKIVCDDVLPISAHAATIVECIQRHRVVVIAGETGSGKTTQLPKLCLAAGRGVSGMIGCTQPRRIAARAVAQRIAQELNTALGDLVGYQVRFNEKVSERSLIKLMTDGILLAEIQADRWLSAYDTLIIDEAHERSLNIDFLLGYLQRLIVKRRDLKVIITSATIDTERFSKHFDNAPIMSIEGRTYPVEVRWRPPEDDAEDLRLGVDPIAQVLDEITQEDAQGDVLVFLSGEREIRELHQILERKKYRETEILPLYARLSTGAQDRVFNPGIKRRIVLATNVAETSLTVPRIRYVVDPGVARLNRFSHRNKVQRLHVERISQASADQRKGRCGRVASGICYRLYSEQDFNSRALYTEPELLRSSLASVILRLMSLKLGAIETFSFLDKPSERAIADGYQQLVELGAVGADRQHLTSTGLLMAQMPIDVKLGRMMVEANRLHCLREIEIIAAFLSVQDPRERPVDRREQADAAHRHYAHPQSDFMGIINLWTDYRLAHEELTQSKLREWCERRFLSFLRMREWRELHRQLHLLAQHLHWSENKEDSSYETIHKALLSGFPTQVARRDEKNIFIGTRSRQYAIFPGSALAKKPPLWVLSALLLDTQKLYALMNAQIESAWIEQQSAHLCKHRYFDPHWSMQRGRVQGYESVSMFGLILVEKRPIHYGSVNPAESRIIFIRDALLTGNIRCKADFVQKNQTVLKEAHKQEARLRRRGIVRSSMALEAWLSQRIPDDLCTTHALDRWYQTLEPAQRLTLVWSMHDVLEETLVSVQDYPAQLNMGEYSLPLRYHFEPGHAEDGVTLELPLTLLNALSIECLTWLVPGLLRDKVEALLRGLPKAIRRHFVPVPDFAQSFIEAIYDASSPLRWPNIQAQLSLMSALSAHLKRVTGIEIDLNDFKENELPNHLRFNIELRDEHGKPLMSARDARELQACYADQAYLSFSKTAQSLITREGLVRWDFENLPSHVLTDIGIKAYPALVAGDENVAIRLFERETDAIDVHKQGVLQLLRLALADKKKGLRKNIILTPSIAIAFARIASVEVLRDDVLDAAIDDLTSESDLVIRERAMFECLLVQVSKQLGVAVQKRFDLVRSILKHYAEVLPLLKKLDTPALQESYQDIRLQLAALLRFGFARAYALNRLEHVERYVKAVQRRIERIFLDINKDLKRQKEISFFVEAYQNLQIHWAEKCKAHSAYQLDHQQVEGELDQLRWFIEEYRVQLFAQELKTHVVVSDKRLRQMLESVKAAVYGQAGTR